MNEVMKLNLKTLSPVHIGSGAEITPSEYWYDQKSHEVNRLNLESLTRDPEFAEHLEKFVDGAAQARQIDRYVPKEILARHILYSLPAPGGAQYPIRAQVKSGGRVMIPGSSIKGSLLSALLWKVLGEKGRRDEQVKASIRTACRDIQGKSYNELLEACLKDICGNPSVNRPSESRFLKWLNVSDTDFLKAKGNLMVARVEVVGAKQSKIPMLLETIREGVTLIFEMVVPSEACRKQKPEWGVKKVLETADAFYRRVWKETEDNSAAPEGGWLLRLGQGSGAWATSLLLLAADLGLRQDYAVQPPATRKKVNGVTSLGWVFLTAWKPGQEEGADSELSNEGETNSAPAATGPSAKLMELLGRLKTIKSHDAGQVGLFLDGLKSLEREGEKVVLAKAVEGHFDRKMLKKHKRVTELKEILAKELSDN